MVSLSLLYWNNLIHSVPEIDPEVDFDSRRAVYFRQMRYGLFVSVHASPPAEVDADLPLDSYGIACKRHGLICINE